MENGSKLCSNVSESFPKTLFTDLVYIFTVQYFFHKIWNILTSFMISQLQRNVRTAKSLTGKCAYDEVCLRKSVLTAKCPYGEISLRRSVFTAKCPHGEMYHGKMSHGEFLRRKAREPLLVSVNAEDNKLFQYYASVKFF